MAAFTAGNIIVYRIGGTTSAGAATFLDEYTSAGALVQTIALPTATTGANDALTDSGQSTFSGEITEAGSNGAILMAGYDTAVGTTGETSSTAPRVVGIVSATGTIDTSTASSTYSGSRVTSAASADGQNIYIATSVGVGYTTAGSTAASVTLTTTGANQVVTANGQLYYSSSTAGTPGIYALGTGLPTTSGQSSTLIAASTKPVAFAFASLAGGATDTLYVADNTNGIEKFSLVNNVYTQTGTVALTGAVGLAVTVNNGVATLVVTTPTTIRTLVDSSGAGGTLSSSTPLTTLVTVASGNVFKGDVVYQAATCFASGTRIRTADGDVAVEALAVGDLAVTASGERRAIRWLGHRRTDCRFHPRPREVMPVRIAAHALGRDRPARDLVVSPGHSICIDVFGEVLIPAMALVNGLTIVQEEVDSVTYWHVELEGGHDVVLAENLPAESYLDMGNRGFFVEADVVDLDAGPDASTSTHADFCRPFHDSGALVAVVRARLAARAVALGWRLEDTPLDAVHLVVDGMRVEALVRDRSLRFVVPATAREVWLVSPTRVPSDGLSESDDGRALGAPVARLTLASRDLGSREIAADDPRLCVGFHEAETGHRWTAGRALIPAELWHGCTDDFFLRVDLAYDPLPRWVLPSRAAAPAVPMPVAA